jgi:hypothetical protein
VYPSQKHIDILPLLQVQNEGASPDVADGEEIHKGGGWGQVLVELNTRFEGRDGETIIQETKGIKKSFNSSSLAE